MALEEDEVGERFRAIRMETFVKGKGNVSLISYETFDRFTFQTKRKEEKEKEAINNFVESIESVEKHFVD